MTASAIPGTDPAIQRWFLLLDRAKTAFDKALFQAERGVANKMPSDCQALATTAQKITGQLPALVNVAPAGARLAAAISPVMQRMATMAAACLASDWTVASIAMSTGIAQQAQAQTVIDEILDGDA